MNSRNIRAFIALAFAVMSLPGLTGCLGMPEGVEPVADFEAERYLGRWYEIARLDHSFERGLSNVTAEYSRRDDGDIRVINRGFDMEDAEWSDIEGRARFVDSEDRAYLKVSFFGPFFGSYVVFELADDYSHAFVSGYNRDYLWLLAREPEVSDALKERFLQRAGELGFDVSEVAWVAHDRG
jgi:apolipoprotein D and lipocalin family protein